MEKENHEDGDDLPPELNQVKAQIERERFLHISNTFELRCESSVSAHSFQHQFLALIRWAGKDNYGRKKNMLYSRMETPLHHFNGFSYNSKEADNISEEVTLPSTVELPFVKKLPESITWVYTDSNRLMVESDSVFGKLQLRYVDGEALELGSDNEENEEDEEETEKENEEDEEETEKENEENEEETEKENEEDEEETEKENEEDEEEIEKEKFEFSEDVDRFIWTIGQEYSLDDLVVLSAISKFLQLDVSVILERYNELNKLKNEGNTGEVPDKINFTSFPEILDRHFCRRCLIFGCPLHEEYQPVFNTSEKKSNLFENEDVRKQCSEHCYVKLMNVREADHAVDTDNSKGKNVVSDTNTETEDCVLTDTNRVIKDITDMSLAYNEWTPVEKDLYLKGVEIFGRNSCFITRNLLWGHKTCLEVYNYMREQDQEHNETAETDNQVSKEVSRKKPRVVRRKVRLQKYACYPLALRNSAKEQDKSYKQYTPCTCEPICGDQCPCLTSGNCCEKYCGCPKKCKNRFGGCICGKGQCINRQCPCFACSRECDPDICRSCSIGCGDGSLGEISRTSQCKNMKFLLKKYKRILLARSDCSGWGAFTRHSVKKNEFLGEYTGELISHEESNERGTAADKHGFSYLFTLNDKLVIDARRKGNKFRFLNHSIKRNNCYAKLVIVKGDHRIGLFANRAIEEGEELFFDYCYGPGVKHADWIYT